MVKQQVIIIMLIMLFLVCDHGTMALAHSDGLQVDAHLINQNIRVFFLSDFNFTGTGTGPLIFEIIITNHTNLAKQVTLEMLIESDRYGRLAEGTTAPFPLQAKETIYLNNQNLFRQSQQFAFQEVNFETAVADLKDKILATGKLPSDIYRFHFTVKDHIDTETDIIEIDITNSATLDLLTPGRKVEDEDLPQVFSTLPQFRWASNMELFKITVSEKIAGFHDDASPEEIINDQIRLEKYLRISRDHAGTGTSGDTILTSWNYMQYPSAGVLPLERGKTYYWQVIGYQVAAGGTVEIPGEIWGFKIAGYQADLLTPEQQQIMDYLSALLGQDLFDTFCTLGQELDGFVPTGTVTINGRTLTNEELMEFITRFRNGAIEVFNVVIH